MNRHTHTHTQTHSGGGGVPTEEGVHSATDSAGLQSSQRETESQHRAGHRPGTSIGTGGLPQALPEPGATTDCGWRVTSVSSCVFSGQRGGQFVGSTRLGCLAFILLLESSRKPFPRERHLPYLVKEFKHPTNARCLASSFPPNPRA